MRNWEIERGADWEFVRGRRRWREVDVEVHGASQGKAEMLESLVVTSEHLAAADLGGFCLHIWF